MYEAVKNINRLVPKEKLIIQPKDGPNSNEKKQSETIAKYFENIFCTNPAPMQDSSPTPRLTPFTSSLKISYNHVSSD